MNENNYQYYLGVSEKIFCGYSTNHDITAHCASGGIVTTVFMWLLENDLVDGCLVYSLWCEDGQFTVKHNIVTSAEQLITAGGSIYIDFPAISRSVLDSIREFKGKIAVVGLPCSINALQKIKAKDDVLNKKIVFTLGLFCGHTSKRSLIETVLKRKKIDIRDIETFAFRKGLWRGKAEIFLKNGEKIEFPSSHFTTYQNLFIDSSRRCLNCVDHYAESADLSTGDIWKKKYSKSERKHSIFATRSPLATSIIEKMISSEQLHVDEVDQKLLFQANKRAAVFHKAIKARALVGRLFGVAIKAPKSAPPPRWNEIAATFMVMPFIRLSDSKYRKIIFAIPRKILYSILIGFKLLTNF